ncbi:MAG: DNA polymerase III subunit delta' [Candidatus Faecivicinus sp.]|nr:DNA polymerase III subunit delta' [Candidatus Faecivicinus sp.]
MRIELVGQGDKMEHLMRSVQAGRIVHALLFTGPRGSGKKTAANLFAQAIFCTGADRPCGVCPACKRVQAGVHPDLHRVVPEKNAIRVDAIRELIDALSMRPYEGGYHVAIIEQADRMNPSAQNALLKTLESPVGDVMFFLISDTPGALLPTVVSRCQEIRMRPLNVEDCARALVSRGIPGTRAKMLSGLAQGSVGRALELNEDGEFFSLRDRTLSALGKLRDAASVAGAAAEISDLKGGEETVLEILELWARDLMAIQNGAEPFSEADAEKLRADRLSGARLLKAVMLARQRLSANVAWTSVLESMFFSLIE